MKRRRDMMLGPVQLLVVGLQNDRMKGDVARELQAASQSGAIRVLDALAILKTPDGKVTSLGASDLTTDERAAFGSLVGALMGFGALGTFEAVEAGGSRRRAGGCGLCPTEFWLIAGGYSRDSQRHPPRQDSGHGPD
jgi:hypothetical protein